MKRKRAALFFPSLRVGGVQRSMLNLSRGLLERGIGVDFVLVRAEGHFMSQVPAEAEVVDLGGRRALASLPGLVRYLRRARPDALLSAQTHVNLIGLWAWRLAGRPCRLVISEHSTISAVAQNAPRGRERWRIPGARLFYPWADHVVAVSHGVAQDLCQVAGLRREMVRVIYNPIVSEDLAIKAAQPVDHPWFSPGGPPVVLGVGRLTSAKDFSTLLHAFALLRRRRACRLVILGEGEGRTELEALRRRLGLEGEVALPGFVENPYAYMARAQLFVLSSRWEGLPSVLVEALACGVPVVATDCPSGPGEILAQGRYGLLVPVGDARSLADAMEKRLASPPPRQRLLERAAAFSVTKATEQYLDVLFG